jgi:hypothetical protein
MKMPPLSRRDLLSRSLLLTPTVAFLSLAAKSARAADCADPTESLRASLRYVEASPDPKQTCSACGFFTPDAKPTACGTCTIFNGAANPQGRCDSWAAKG